MKVLYYTSGVSGSGRVVRGISIGNAFRRQGNKVDFSILSSSPFAHLADIFDLKHREIPVEGEDKLAKTNYTNSELYRFLTSLNPDILLIDLLWFSTYNFIEELPCKKIFLWQRMDERFFTINLPDGASSFKPETYNLLLARDPSIG